MNVMAVTGRRIDAADAEQARFPLEHAPAVRLAIAEAMRETETQAVVCSAACGTDLLALDVASELGIPAWVVLPFARERFRETSVVDRPGDWGALFDTHMDAAEERGAVRLIDPVEDEQEAYLRVLDAILDFATQLASAPERGHAIALVAWDGTPRGPDDFTAAFITQARQRNFTVRELLTT